MMSLTSPLVSKDILFVEERKSKVNEERQTGTWFRNNNTEISLKSGSGFYTLSWVTRRLAPLSRMHWPCLVQLLVKKKKNPHFIYIVNRTFWDVLCVLLISLRGSLRDIIYFFAYFFLVCIVSFLLFDIRSKESYSFDYHIIIFFFFLFHLIPVFFDSTPRFLSYSVETLKSDRWRMHSVTLIWQEYD